MPNTRRAAWHSLAIGILALAAVATFTGCVPEPSPSTGPSRTASGSTGSTSSASAGPTSPAPQSSASLTAAAGDIALPTACEQLYSPAMLSSLQQQVPPLNDPGVTMYSSQQAETLEALNSGAPTIRCTWGVPSSSGLSTNVTIVDAATTARILEALRAGGFDCSNHLSGTLCTFQQDSVTQDDTIVHRGETHFLRGNGWVTTAWITVDPPGYTDDIVGALWG